MKSPYVSLKYLLRAHITIQCGWFEGMGWKPSTNRDIIPEGFSRSVISSVCQGYFVSRLRRSRCGTQHGQASRAAPGVCFFVKARGLGRFKLPSTSGP